MGGRVWRALWRHTTRLFIAAVVLAYVATSNFLTAPPKSVTYDVANTAIDQSNTTVGISDTDLYAMSPADVNKTLDEMQSLGVQDVRILMPWALVEPLNGVYNWSQLDMIVNAANARNMNVVGILNSTPIWEASPLYSGAPNPTDYAAFASTVATRYAGKVSAYEVWNEPNSYVFYNGPNGGPDAAGYTALLQAAYPAIKSADPSALVIAGSLISVVSVGNLTTDPVTFVQQMYADGAKGYFDALSFHPYQYTLPFSQGAAVPDSPLNQLEAIREVMVANGDSAKLVWATEYGEPSSVAGDQNQADYISSLLNGWSTLSGTGPIFIYTTRDRATGSSNPEDTFGVFQTDWMPKAAAQVIQQWIAAHSDPVGALGAALAAAVQQVVQGVVTAYVNALTSALTTAISNAISAALTNAVSSALSALAASLGGALGATQSATTAASPVQLVAAASLAAPIVGNAATSGLSNQPQQAGGTTIQAAVTSTPAQDPPADVSPQTSTTSTSNTPELKLASSTGTTASDTTETSPAVQSGTSTTASDPLTSTADKTSTGSTMSTGDRTTTGSTKSTGDKTTADSTIITGDKTSTGSTTPTAGTSESTTSGGGKKRAGDSDTSTPAGGSAHQTTDSTTTTGTQAQTKKTAADDGTKTPASGSTAGHH